MNFETARTQMIKQQIRAWNVLDSHILELIETTPREDFVPTSYRSLAFADTNIPLGNDQVMLTPKEEARILQALKIQPTDRVLEIGTGSGYFTALLAKQAQSVVSLDISSEFSNNAKQKLTALGLTNVDLRVGDAAQGYDKDGPYDVIVITGALYNIPEIYRKILNTNGRLFAIVGQKPAMEALLMIKTDKNHWQSQLLFETVVPLLINAKQPNPFTF